MTASGAAPRIFVTIASYRDPECQWTVKDLFEKAAHPERVNAGICWQYDPMEDGACFAVDYPRPEQVRVIQYHARDSHGANWARTQALTLWQGEEYILVIDSHMRFEKGWDNALLAMLKQCPSDKPLLTGWLPGYKPPHTLDPNNEKIERLHIAYLGDEKEAQFINLGRHYELAASVRGRMDPACSCAVNCLFGPARAFSEVPFDPAIDFWGDEINQSVRLWTHGWDFFQIDRRVLYHYWDPESIKDRDEYRDRKNPRHQRARERNLHLFGLAMASNKDSIRELDKYPLGTVRSLSDYWAFAGIDPVRRRLDEKARKGKWSNVQAIARDSGSHGLRPLVRDGGKAAIFVNIASYRDRECRWTIRDLFAKAAYPDRINVGICLQVDPEADKACMVDIDRPGQVHIMQVHYKDSQGANWARHQASQLWNVEEYMLQIDSHMRFEPGWDETLIDMLERCPSSEHSVLSTYVPRYTPPDDRQAYPGQILRIRVHEFGSKESPQLLHLTRVNVPLADQERSGLYSSPFYIANFMFCRAALLQTVPFDPYIQFWGDEITYSARLWTHGYDIYQPDRVVLYHYWRRDELVPIQDYRQMGTPRSQSSFARVRHVLGFEQAKDPAALVEIERYGLGRERSLKDLWEFAGIDWQRRTIAKAAEEGRWNMAAKDNAIAHIAGDPGLSDLRPSIRDAGIASIFVNIASYRDPECQWTVKDLFEKATYPDRINVGICWQFDPEEDKHCFEVVTRPEQVRMLPVDWREAEGVCWARWQTQQLWEGENYTLMIDSHMRFVPGWDELMIQELAACESAKPVLSCSPVPYIPPDHLGTNMNPTIRRVKPFMPDGNIRCQGELLDRAPSKPLKGAFLVANFVFSRSDIIKEVPYDPYLYFDQEEITYAVRLYTHGWDVFSPRRQFLYHYYNDGKAPGGSVRPLHWKDMHKEDSRRIHFLRERGYNRFNHMTGFKLSDDPEVTKELDRYGFGQVRTLQQFEEYTGVDFKRKAASEKALRCLFIKDLNQYRDRPIYIPEIDGQKKAEGEPVRLAPPVTMLEPGDFVPMFEVIDTDRKMRAVETYGGRHCIVFFLPAGGYSERFFQELQRQLGRSRLEIWQMFVIDDTVDNLIAFKEKTGTPHPLWADPDHKLARAFGICKPGDTAMPPAGYVLSPNLKILRRHINMNPAQLAAAVVNDCRRALDNYRLENRNIQTISQLPPALIVPDVLTPELCAKCIQSFRTGYTFDGTVGIAPTRAYRPDTKLRTDHVVGGKLLEEIDEKLSRSFFPEIKKIFGFEVTRRELYKVGLYTGEKGGFFRQHRDNFDKPLGYRRIAATIHLNDDYEGGGLHFPEYDKNTYRPAAGAGIAFSCATLHEARPVTKGERFILVGFFHGEQDEAYRLQYAANAGDPLRIRDYTPTLRHYPEIRQSRDFVTQWYKQNVSFGEKKEE